MKMNKSSYLPRDFTAEFVVAGRLWRRMTARAMDLPWDARAGESAKRAF